MLYLTKSPPSRTPSLRAAAPKRASAKTAPTTAVARAAIGKPPAVAKATKPTPDAPAPLRSQIRVAVAEALGVPLQAPGKAAAKAASGLASGTSTKAAAPAKRATTAKAPAALPPPRQAPPKAVIRFPRLPVQVRAARYQSAQEQQADLNRFRKFLSVARMVRQARKLTADERHLIECARARIKEIQALGLVGVR